MHNTQVITVKLLPSISLKILNIYAQIPCMNKTIPKAVTNKCNQKINS